MRRTSLAWLPVLASCGSVPGLSPRTADAEQAVVAAFTSTNPAGRVGVEVGGKGVWYAAPMFDNGCLQNKELAHKDLAHTRPAAAKGVPRMSPTYAAQDHFVYPTERGWCVYIGNDPQMSVRTSSYLDGKYRVEVDFALGTGSPWWECVADDVKHRFFEVVEKEDGTMEVLEPVDLMQGDCPRPLPAGEGRTAGIRPSKPALRAPQKDEIVKLAGAFDDALFERDFVSALSMVSCYNLFEEKPYGTCSAGELIAVGPLAREGTGPQHGVPWLEYNADRVEDIGRIVPDSSDRSLYHVELKHPRTGHRRTFAVQWVDGEWKLVGVVGRRGEGLTSMRFVYDLDRKDKREIFERRMKGEAIGEDGRPLDPFAVAEGG